MTLQAPPPLLYALLAGSMLVGGGCRFGIDQVAPDAASGKPGASGDSGLVGDGDGDGGDGGSGGTDGGGGTGGDGGNGGTGGDDGSGGSASVDAGPSCSGACIHDHADVSCDETGCVIDACWAQWDNCDARDDNGCEQSLATMAHCGACDAPCNLSHATASCASAQCLVQSCEVGYGDCDQRDDTGCEQALDTLVHCGACNTACEPANATGTCQMGSCGLAACDNGFTDCDGLPGNGCEVSGASNCGGFTLTVDSAQVDAPLTNFPVLVRIGDGSLAAARPDGFDLSFWSSDGVTALAFEIERWVQASGELVAWVRLPLVSEQTDTVFKLRYADGGSVDRSDAAAVWADGFRGVYHMDYGGGAGTQPDSTANSNDATPDTGVCADAAPEDLAAGVAGHGLTFGGHACDRLVAQDDPSLDFGNTERMTMSVWVKATAAAGYQTMISKRTRISEIANYQIGFDQNSLDVGYFDGPNFLGVVFPSPALTADSNTWTYLAVTVAATSGTSGTCTFFKNGVQISTSSRCGLPPNDELLWIGGQDQEVGEAVQGALDEVRVSEGVRSAAWFRAEYNNQRGGSTFLQVAAD